MMRREVRPLAVLAALLGAGVLAFASFGDQAWAQAGHEQKVTIEAFAFAPASIEVEAGDAVVWTNHDFVPHTATAEAWTSGPIKNGASARVGFPTAGTFAYKCLYHPGMKGVVVVKPRAP